MTRALPAALALLAGLAPAHAHAQPQKGPQHGEMAGYLLVPNDQVPKTYGAGFAMYVAAWPLVKDYPGHNFQTGLFGTWMFAQHDGEAPKKAYSDVEGGLG